MNSAQRFTCAVAALPKPVRERLDGDMPLDWGMLEDARIGTELGAAARAQERLPAVVEMLVQRLIRDVGIEPADLVAGEARQGTAVAWVQRAAVEPEGESYRIRNNRRGEVYTNVRPEAVAGYATLAMELATAVHDSCERWIEAGHHPKALAGDKPDHLARCAAAMRAQLTSRNERIPGPRTTIGLADAFELAWNDQSFEARAALSAFRPAALSGACAPRENPYAPSTGHRLHAYNLGEVRWLRALAASAAAGSSAIEREVALPRTTAAGTVEEMALADIGTLEARIQAATEETGVLALGSGPEKLVLDEEVVELMRAAKKLPSAVRRRMGNAYGIAFSQALARLQDADGAGSIAAELSAPRTGETAPKWLEELAATLFMDTGVETRSGLRTAATRLDPEEGAGASYTAIEVGTGARSRLTLDGLVQQARLSILFAHEVWTGLAMLRSAGKEGGWILNEGELEGRELKSGERAAPEAARHIEQALDRVQRAHARVHGDRSPSTLEQAVMVANTLTGVGEAVRTAAGWPDMTPPNARDPADMAHVARVAEALRGDIRSIANHFIVGGITSAEANRATDGERTHTPADRRTTLRAIPGQGEG